MHLIKLNNLSYHDITHYSMFSMLILAVIIYSLFKHFKLGNIRMPKIDKPLDNLFVDVSSAAAVADLSSAGENVTSNM